jgi:hypothetical protein
VPRIKLPWNVDEARNPILGYMVRLDCRCISSSSLTEAYSPVCQKQILTFPSIDLNDEEEIAVQRSLNRGSSRGIAEYEEDISYFKRIVQETANPPTLYPGTNDLHPFWRPAHWWDDLEDHESDDDDEFSRYPVRDDRYANGGTSPSDSAQLSSDDEDFEEET